VLQPELSVLQRNLPNQILTEKILTKKNKKSKKNSDPAMEEMAMELCVEDQSGAVECGRKFS
jgi:hypothetical protein